MTLPRPLVREIGWHRGDLVAIAVDGDRLIVRRVDESALIVPPPPSSDASQFGVSVNR